MKRLSKRFSKGKRFKFEGFESGNPNDNFEMLECLGEGTYGSVYISEDKKAGRQVALKIVPIDNDEEEIQQEIDIMRMCDSPYITKCFSAYQSPDFTQVWMAMEICDAGSVNDLMFVTDQTMTESQIREIAASATQGLAYLHDKKVLHRDVKCGNILLNREGEVKLADFGVSAVLIAKSERRTTAIGAPYWMAPEVISEDPYDGRCDVWSLGITCIEAAEARPPNSHIHPMRALFLIPQQDPPKLAQPQFPKKDWSSDFEDFVSECLIKSHDARPTAQELLQHKFIQKTVKKLTAHNGKSSLMKKLVEKNMPLIREFRSLEEDDSDEEVFDAEEEMMKDIATGKRDGQTIFEVTGGQDKEKEKEKEKLKGKEKEKEKEKKKDKKEEKKEKEATKAKAKKKVEIVEPPAGPPPKPPSDHPRDIVSGGRRTVASERNIAPLRPPSVAREEFRQNKTLKVGSKRISSKLSMGAAAEGEKSLLNKSKQNHMDFEDVKNYLQPSQAQGDDDVEVIKKEEKKAVQNFGSAVMTKQFINLLKTAQAKEPTLFEILEQVDDPEDAMEMAVNVLRIAAAMGVKTRKDLDEEEA